MDQKHFNVKQERKKKAEQSSQPVTDRLPPHSIEAEQGVLGCIMLSPNESMMECISKLKHGSQSFYDIRHRNIYEAMLSMHSSMPPVPIDIITLQQRLKDSGMLDVCGGLVYVATLPDLVPSAANIGYYIEILREKFVLRSAIGACAEIVSKVYDFTGNTDVLIGEIEQDIRKISTSLESGSSLPWSPKDLVLATQEKITATKANKGSITGIPTGFIDYDQMTGGLHLGEMAVIAARPSVGKSSLAMNMADHVSVNMKIPVFVISLEMSAESLMTRMVCARSKVSLGHIKHGTYSDQDMSKMAASFAEISASPIYIDDKCAGSLAAIQARCRMAKEQYGAKLIIVDYIGLMSSNKKTIRSKEEEVADISSGLKWTAKSLGVAMLAINQLNREVEHRKPGSRPKLSDLRGSGAIEQDADLVGLLHRPEDAIEFDITQHTTLIIAKQRNGEVGDIPLVFFRPWTRFESAQITTGHEKEKA